MSTLGVINISTEGINLFSGGVTDKKAGDQSGRGDPWHTKPLNN